MTRYLREAAPELLAACKQLLAAKTEEERRVAVEAGKAAVRKAEPSRLLLRLTRKSATVAGIQRAKAKGKQIGRPAFVLTPAKRLVLAIWKAGEPREPLHVLARAMRCSITTAHKVAHAMTAVDGDGQE